MSTKGVMTEVSQDKKESKEMEHHGLNTKDITE